ncbi:2-hydroxymuconic semialdehyde dehydrogenase [Pseudogemmobacter humi]|uniref:2-hydroxymuconic semialdehyde dehydrogenase n=1 Tax=Pseudogemmobacter humi TaxID=2483812 RepID=A0A3P5XL23_9RHOB|nr:2-hydroxymuconic semialdehyde dehydrogenase [Pseudogemmobacter humi]VDC29342.1 2-hydroxymuconic semialdehyde dehydrogenase [Pseudogemmobacter humi]
MKRFDLFIDGEFRAARSGRSFQKISPVDGRVIGTVQEALAEDVDAAVQAARAALNGSWGQMPVKTRTDLLLDLAHAINRRAADFVEAEVQDTGHTRAFASHVEIPRGAANFEIFANLLKNTGGEFFAMDTPDGAGAVNMELHRPKGVIAVISPWNAPFLLMTWKVGPALACGNTVVVKPSEESPATATLLGEVMNEVGIPKGVYNVIHGFGPGSAGELLTQHKGVDGITFTGETRTGEAIMKQAAVGLRDVSFELGGKNPAIVFADCDMDKAIEVVMRSAFANTGQVCLGTERVYVERPIFDAFTARLKAGAEALKPGGPDDPGTTLGPLISAEHRDKVLSYYQKARDLGATEVTGGGVPVFGNDCDKGFFVQPTIWTGLSDDSAIMREEIFGPCVHISPFDTEDEVIARANDTGYGLSATVLTENLSRAHRVGRRLEAGIIWVNAWFLRDLRTAFGGSKSSGIGREGGVHSLEFYTERSNLCIKL